ncbi:MAG: translocation/assembly module TamB domain-containing protein [Pseudomonadota bacterium]
MRHLLVFVLLLAPLAAHAQNARLEALLEGQLSNEERIVEIDGFAGALSSEATMEALRISDRDGVWIELTDLALDWNRSALLRGRLEVEELSAAFVRVIRPPLPSETVDVPEAEASGFRIPDLPVTIQIDRLAVDRISLAEPVLGEAVEATAELSALLEDGALQVALDAARVDDKPGRAVIDLGFSPETELLRIGLDVSEPPEGIVARALSLPGLPSLTLVVAGEGQLDDFSADIRLATDGVERLGGDVTLTAVTEGRAFTVDLAGDIRPLLEPGSRAFFGDDTRLQARGVNGEGGALTLESLDLTSEALRLSGTAALAAGGAPERFALEGEIGRGERSAIPGTDVTLTGATLDLDFDAAQSDAWTFDVTAREVAASGFAADRLDLDGTGVLIPDSDTPFEGRVTAAVDGLATPGDPALQQALGGAITLATDVIAQAGGAFALENLELEAQNLTATGRADITPTDGRVALVAEIAASAPDLAPFSAISGQSLAGAVSADVTAEAELPGGAIVVSLTGVSEGIDLGIEPLEPLLTPRSDLAIALRRDETGTSIEDFRLDNPEITARVAGSLSSSDGGLDVTARLREIALFTDLVEGPVELDVSLADVQGDRRLSGQVVTQFGLDAEVSGTLAGQGAAVRFEGSLAEVERFVAQLEGTAALTARLDLADIPTLDADFIAEPGIRANVQGPLSGPDQGFDIGAEIENLAAFAEPLPGPATLSARVTDLANGPLIDATLMATPGIEARIEGRPTGDQEGLDITATVADLAPFVPQLAGPARVEARLDDIVEGLLVDAVLTATPGIAAQVDGRATGPDEGFDVTATIADLGVFLPQLAGPARVSARIDDLTDGLLIDADLTATPGLSAQIAGRATGPEEGFDITATARDLGFVAPLLSGPARISARIDELQGALEVGADISASPGLTARIDGTPLGEASRLTFTARAASLAQFVDGLSGGATVSGEARDLTNRPNFDVTLRTDQGARAEVSGTAGLPGGAVDIAANGTAPLALAQGFIGERGLSGQLGFDVRLNGQPALQALTGTATIRDGRLFDPANAITLAPITADVGLSGGQARIDASAGLEGTPIEIAGTAGLAQPFPIDIIINANRLPVRYADILENRTSLALALRGSARRLAISGNIDIADTEIRIPDTGLGGAPDIPPIRHVGAPSDVRQTLDRAGLDLSGIAEEAGTGGPVIPLDIILTATTPVFVRGRGLDAGFTGGVRVTGNARSPVPVGQLDLTRGRLDFLGRRLDLSEGSITVAGSLIPRINIVSRTVVEDITAEIALAGRVTEPELILSSFPELPEDEILARILFGRGIETLSAFQVARLVNSVRKLSGRAGDGVLETTRNALGVDDFDLRTDAETGEAELAVGARLNDNLYSEVEVGAGGSTTINLNLDLTNNTRLQGSASSDGETGIGIFWERDY